jgi:hypothetical protein
MKKLNLLIFILTAILIISCSKDTPTTDDWSTEEYEISFQMSFEEDIYVIYAEFIHDENKSFKRYEDSDDNSAYLEDKRGYIVKDRIGVSFESYATVPTKSIDVQITDIGSNKIVLNESVGNISYDYIGKSKVTVVYDIKTKQPEVIFSD